MHPGFTPISLHEYLDRHMKLNPADDRNELAHRLKWVAEQHMNGRRCDCGEPIWIIGSAVAQLSCFTCITGSANPDHDYELDLTQPLEARAPGRANGADKTSQRIPPKLQPWIEARKRFRLSDAHVQMARELGMNPKKLRRLANHDQEPWKLPLPEFIEQCYYKSFKKHRPDQVRSIERLAKEQTRKQAEKKRLKQEWRANGQVEGPAAETTHSAVSAAHITPAQMPAGDDLPF